MQAVIDRRRQRNAITILALLTLVFLGPVLFAWVLYQKSDQVEFSYKHQGELLPSDDRFLNLAFFREDGVPMSGQDFIGSWWLVYLAPAQCDAHCQNALYQLRQIHIALNKDASRVQRLFLADDTRAMSEGLQSEYPELYRALVSHDDLQDLFRGTPVNADSHVGAVLIIDPRGHSVLRYRGDDEPKSIYDDIKRLLRLSQIG